MALSVSVTACSDAGSEALSAIEGESISGTVENATKESIQKASGEQETKSFQKRLLFNGYNTEEYYFIDENGNPASGVDWKATTERLREKGQNFTDAVVQAIDGSVVYCYRYETVGNGYRYRVYAVDTSSDETMPLWTSDEGWWLESIDFYQGKLYVTAQGENFQKEEAVFVKDPEAFTFQSEKSNLDSFLNAVKGYNLTVYSTETEQRWGSCSLTRVLEETGYVIGYRDNRYVKISADGTVDELPGMPKDYAYVRAYDSQYVIYSAENEGSGLNVWYLTDLTAGKTEKLMDGGDGLSILAYQDGKLYYSETDEKGFVLVKNTIYQMDVRDKSKKALYEMESVPGATEVSPGTAWFQILGGQIYFVKPLEDQLTWVRAEFDGNQASFRDLGLSVGEKNAFRYGTVIYDMSVDNCPFCGVALEKTYEEAFQLDESQSGYAGQINATLRGHLYGTGEGQGGEYSQEPTDEFCQDHQENPTAWCETTEETVSNVRILNDRYLAVDYSEYWYGGGVHGFPGMGQYLFDLTTGEELTIQDFYSGTEDAFKRLVAEKTQEDFRTYKTYKSESPYFAQDEAEVYQEAYDNVSLDTANVTFEENGVYYNFMPYEMGPYSSGLISVFISYQDLLGRPLS